MVFWPGKASVSGPFEERTAPLSSDDLTLNPPRKPVKQSQTGSNLSSRRINKNRTVTHAKSRRNDLSGILGKEKLQLQDRLRKGRRSLSSDDLTVDAAAPRNQLHLKPGRTKQGTETQDESHRQSQQLRKSTLTQKPRRTTEKETFKSDE